MIYTEAQVKSFWSKILKTESCWLWQAALHEHGYGMIGISNKKIERAHRLSWVIHNGPIPEGMFVCHKCDVRSCVNPDHLFIGTNLDNVKDMIGKKRNSKPPDNSEHLRIKLPEEILSKLGTMPDYKLAEIANVCKDVIARNRKKLGIKSYAQQTGSNGRFKKNTPHPRWSRYANGG